MWGASGFGDAIGSDSVSVRASVARRMGAGVTRAFASGEGDTSAVLSVAR